MATIGGGPPLSTDLPSGHFENAITSSSLLLNLISGHYNQDISDGVEKTIGFLMVTWKLFAFLIFATTFLLWWLRNRNRVIEEYKQRKKDL